MTHNIVLYKDFTKCTYIEILCIIYYPVIVKYFNGIKFYPIKFILYIVIYLILYMYYLNSTYELL